MTRMTQNLMGGLLILTFGVATALAGQHGDASPIADDHPVSGTGCEVQIQHPVTYEWITVESFGDAEQADAYRVHLGQHYWVLYHAAATPETHVLGPSDQSDARSQAEMLGQAGLSAELERVEARVVDDGIDAVMRR